MLPQDITKNTRTYTLVTSRANSSVRSDNARPLETPRTLENQSETLKSGKVNLLTRLNSDEVLIGTCPSENVTDRISAQLKLSFNPTSGRTGIEAELGILIEDLVAIASDPVLLAQIINKET